MCAHESCRDVTPPGDPFYFHVVIWFGMCLTLRSNASEAISIRGGMRYRHAPTRLYFSQGRPLQHHIYEILDDLTGDPLRGVGMTSDSGAS